MPRIGLAVVLTLSLALVVGVWLGAQTPQAERIYRIGLLQTARPSGCPVWPPNWYTSRSTSS